MSRRRQAHVDELKRLATNGYEEIAFPKVHAEAGAGRRLANLCTTEERLTDIRTVIVDISAFPNTLSFPILRGLLDVCGKSGGPSELLAFVTDNARLDHAIRKGSLGQPHLIAGFGQNSRGSRGAEPIRVWAPILGRGTDDALRAIATTFQPREVCPVLPFPAENPKLADELMMEHWRFLVDERRVVPGNLIYAAERNPYDVYRTLVRFADEYSTTLKPLGGARVSLSAHGSKLLSLGALLAAYDAGLAVYGVRANVYELEDRFFESPTNETAVQTCLWLRGEPYQELTH